MTKSNLTVDHLADFLGVHGYNYHSIMMTPALCNNAARDIISRFEQSESDIPKSQYYSDSQNQYLF